MLKNAFIFVKLNSLGPALAFSIGFSSKKPGSQIILCTDGCANVGMGSMNTYGHNGSGEAFYDELADYAKSVSATVNVISMEGTDCKLALLGKLADKTNGMMTIVNPLKMGAEFASILENRIVATNVIVKIIVNKRYLYVRDEALEEAEAKAIDSDDAAKAKEALNAIKKSVSTKDMGNVNIETETTFEFGCRKLSDKRQAIGSLPFQLQVTYTNSKDGAKYIRVYNKTLDFTTERSTVESNLTSVDMVFSNAMQKISHFAMANNVATAQYRTKALDSWIVCNSYECMSYNESASAIKLMSKQQQSRELSDQQAEMLFKAKKATSKRVLETETFSTSKK